MARDWFFPPLQAGSVSYRYLSFDARHSKRFQTRTGFRYEQVPFKTGLTVLVKYFQAFSKLLTQKFSSHNHFVTFRLLPKNTNIKIFTTVTLPLVLYGCETWSLIKTEGVRKQRAEEDMWVYRDKGSNSRLDTTAQWGTSGHSSQNIIRVTKSKSMRLAGHVAYRDGKICIQGFGRKAWGKETAWNTKCSWGR